MMAPDMVLLRAGEDPNANEANKAANKKAHDDAWKRVREILNKSDVLLFEHTMFCG